MLRFRARLEGPDGHLWHLTEEPAPVAVKDLVEMFPGLEWIRPEGSARAIWVKKSLDLTLSEPGDYLLHGLFEKRNLMLEMGERIPRTAPPTRTQTVPATHSVSSKSAAEEQASEEVSVYSQTESRETVNRETTWKVTKGIRGVLRETTELAEEAAKFERRFAKRRRNEANAGSTQPPALRSKPPANRRTYRNPKPRPKRPVAKKTARKTVQRMNVSPSIHEPIASGSKRKKNEEESSDLIARRLISQSPPAEVAIAPAASPTAASSARPVSPDSNSQITQISPNLGLVSSEQQRSAKKDDDSSELLRTSFFEMLTPSGAPPPSSSASTIEYETPALAAKPNETTDLTGLADVADTLL